MIMIKRVPAVLLLLAVLAPPRAWGQYPQLGTLSETMTKSCDHLLVQSTVADYLRRQQILFSRDFIRFDPSDDKQGLLPALINLFPRTSVLFSDQPIAHDKVNTHSISYRLRRAGHREADRTLQSIVLLQKIIRGDAVDAFATPIKPINPGADDITRVRQIVFDFLTEQPGVELNESVFEKVKIEKLHAMIVRLVYHDQGKFESVLSEYKKRLAEIDVDPTTMSADHDWILEDVLHKFPQEMAPDYQAIFPEPRALMSKSQIGEINPGRFFQFEAPAAHLVRLTELDWKTFEFWLIKEMFDVGGVKASDHPEGSFWIKPVIANYFKLYDDFKSGKIRKSPQSIVTYHRSMLRDIGGELEMPVKTNKDLAMVKLARLFRLNQFPSQSRQRRVSALSKSFSLLDKTQQARILYELKKSGVDDGWALTFGYVPQLAENIQKQSGTWIAKTPEGDAEVTDESIEQSLTDSLQMFFRVIQTARAEMKKLKLRGNGEFTLELPDIATQVLKEGTDSVLNSEIKFELAGNNSAHLTTK